MSKPSRISPLTRQKRFRFVTVSIFGEWIGSVLAGSSLSNTSLHALHSPLSGGGKARQRVPRLLQKPAELSFFKNSANVKAVNVRL